MDRITTEGRTRTRGRAAALVAAVALSAAAIALTGCDVASSGPLATSPVTANSIASNPASRTAASWSATGTAETTACPACPSTSTAGVEGAVIMLDGVQCLEIVAKGESYSPTLFNVKAGVPVRVNFSGKAIGCFKQPTFKSLGKKLDISSGFGTIDLGPLEPGSYEWASSLGVGPGTIVAK
jgi:hypothetical protein